MDQENNLSVRDSVLRVLEKKVPVSAYDETIVLGERSQFNDLYQGDDPFHYFLHDDKVIFISMPGEIHEHCCMHLPKEVFGAIPLKSFPDKRMTGTTTCRYYNLLGCGLTQGDFKQPDGGILLSHRNRDQECNDLKSQRFPNIQFEIAHKNESLFHLLVECAAWLNKTTDVQYVFAVKIFPNQSVRFFLLERRAQIDPQLANYAYFGKLVEHIGDYKLECKILEPINFQLQKNNKKNDIENAFGFVILCDWTLVADNYLNQNLVVNLPLYDITVDLKNFFQGLFALFFELRDDPHAF